MELGLKDRAVLVTGATGGIGQAVARAFAAEGARVALGYAADAEAAEKLAAELGDAFPVRYRIGEPGSVEHAVTAVEQRFGSLDVLVAGAMAAGGLRPPGTAFETLSPDNWSEFVTMNLASTLRTIQLAVARMRPAGWGRVVLVSSVVATRGKREREFYGTVKAGLHGAVRSLMWDLRDTGVLVNLVSPGLTCTPRVNADLPAHRRAEEENATPTGRLSTPEDIARAVVFLGSAANTNIMGEELVVAGGR